MARAWLVLLLVAGCADVFGVEEPLLQIDAGAPPVSPLVCSGFTTEGHCYERFGPVDSWTRAKMNCEQKYGRTLAILQTAAEIQVVDQMLDHGDSAYVGASDLDTPGTYVWVDGQVLYPGTQGWLPAQPDHAPEDHCVVARDMSSSFGLEDHFCKDPIDYICERAL